MLRRIAFGLAVSAMTLLAAPAEAATATATLNVRANVRGHCTIGDPQGFDFLDYTPSAGTLDVTLNVVVTCTTNTSFSLDLDNGAHFAAATRNMANAGGELLAYEFYTDTQGGTVWGVGNHPAIVAGSPGFVNYNIPVYGRIPGTQAVTAGVYTDTVGMTLNF